MNIIEIYRKYNIPENLQLHMLRVAACGNLILDNWIGDKIDKDSLIRILLLHDMGNIVKITPDQNSNPIFLAFREEWIRKYGNDDHVITEEICRIEGLTEEEIKIMNDKIFMKNDRTAKSNSYITKIASYCDQRVAPNGVSSLQERMEEGKIRYQNRPGTSFNNPRTDEMINSAIQIENQIMKYCKLEKNQINDETIEEYITKLREFNIENYRTNENER